MAERKIDGRTVRVQQRGSNIQATIVVNLGFGKFDFPTFDFPVLEVERVLKEEPWAQDLTAQHLRNTGKLYTVAAHLAMRRAEKEKRL